MPVLPTYGPLLETEVKCLFASNGGAPFVDPIFIMLSMSIMFAIITENKY